MEEAGKECYWAPNDPYRQAATAPPPKGKAGCRLDTVPWAPRWVSAARTRRARQNVYASHASGQADVDVRSGTFA